MPLSESSDSLSWDLEMAAIEQEEHRLQRLEQCRNHGLAMTVAGLAPPSYPSFSLLPSSSCLPPSSSPPPKGIHGRNKECQGVLECEQIRGLQ
eukprot:1333737-Pyramimonas_sp.AAC.1